MDWPPLASRYCPPLPAHTRGLLVFFCGFQAIAALSKEAARKRAERAAALAAVKVTDEDITLVQTHMELSDKEAELALRTNGGDVALTLRRLVTPNTAAVVAAV